MFVNVKRVNDRGIRRVRVQFGRKPHQFTHDISPNEAGALALELLNAIGLEPNDPTLQALATGSVEKS